MVNCWYVRIRKLNADQLALATTMDISDEGDHVYGPTGERLAKPFARRVQTEEDWEQRLAHWRAALEVGAVGLGAFEGSTFAGLAIVHLTVSEGVAQLFALYVDREHRRRGAGSDLLAEAERLSRDSGARVLYVSAVPNGSAVGFYLTAGFEFAPVSDLPLQQPQDLRMLKPLKKL